MKKGKLPLKKKKQHLNRKVFTENKNHNNIKKNYEGYEKYQKIESGQMSQSSKKGRNKSVFKNKAPLRSFDKP